MTVLEERTEQWRGRPYAVRTVTGVPIGKIYRCPGCDQQIRGGQHLVAWPREDLDAEDRRHWHASCWRRRDDRTPVIQRSRAAPRY